MPIGICPHCNTRFVYSGHIGDYVHDCSQTNASPSLKQDDVVVIGNWEDSNISGTKPPQEVLRQGITNELQGTRAGILGYDKEANTARGVRASTRRQKNHSEYINLKNKDN